MHGPKNIKVQVGIWSMKTVPIPCINTVYRSSFGPIYFGRPSTPTRRRGLDK